MLTNEVYAKTSCQQNAGANVWAYRNQVMNGRVNDEYEQNDGRDVVKRTKRKERKA